MSALIILVSASSRTLRHTEAVLSERGYLVAALLSSADANLLLDSVTPDLLIADLRAGEYPDLQIAVRSRADHPDVPVIVTTSEHDEIAAAEAGRHGAAFIVEPLAKPEAFLSVVDELIAKRRREQPPVRRWFRAPAPRDVVVSAAAAHARIIDMSYGGVRLAFRRPCDIPSTFDIAIPPAGISVRAQRIWTAPSATGDHFWCGAEVVGAVDAPWRRFIDSLRAESGA